MHLRTVNNLGAVATGSGEGASVIAGKPGDAGGTWTFRDAGGGRYRITNALGRDLTENTGTYFANTKGWKGSSEQKWEVKNVSGDRYVIRISDQDCLTYHEDDKEARGVDLRRLRRAAVDHHPLAMAPSRPPHGRRAGRRVPSAGQGPAEQAQWTVPADGPHGTGLAERPSGTAGRRCWPCGGCRCGGSPSHGRG